MILVVDLMLLKLKVISILRLKIGELKLKLITLTPLLEQSQLEKAITLSNKCVTDVSLQTTILKYIKPDTNQTNTYCIATGSDLYNSAPSQDDSDGTCKKEPVFFLELLELLIDQVLINNLKMMDMEILELFIILVFVKFIQVIMQEQ